MKRLLIVFGLVTASLLLNAISPNLSKVYAQNRVKWIFNQSEYDIPVTISVTDSTGKSTITEYKIDVLNSSNFPRATAGMPYEFLGLKNRVDVFFEIVEGPEWLQIDSETGKLTGTPRESDVGFHFPITIHIVKRAGYSREEIYYIDVRSFVDSEEMYLPPATISKKYYYTLPQINPNDTYKIIEGPGWLGIESITGKLTGIRMKLIYFSLPLIAENGTVYVTTQYDGHTLIAVSPDGTELWRQVCGDSGVLTTQPGMGRDGTIYVASKDEYYAVEPDSGEILWIYPLNAESSPAIGVDGTIYVGSFDGFLYALNPDGTLKWKCLIGNVAENTSQRIKSSPAIGSDGTIYVSRVDSYLFAVNPWGTIKWENNVSSSSPSIGGDGTIYAGFGSYLNAINPDGTVKWTQPKNYYSKPVVSADGTIYIGNENGLCALNEDGSIEWEYPFEYSFNSTALIGTGGIIYFVSPLGNLYALNPNGTVNWIYEETLSKSTYTESGHVSISSDGTLYVATRVGLYAFQTDSQGLQENSPWPCFNANSQRTGNSIDMITNVEYEDSELLTDDKPVIYVLGKNFPNPFNSATTISFSLPKPGNTTITVFSISGQKVGTILDEYKDAGNHSVLFDGKDLAAGLYFYRLESPGYTETEKMLFIK